MASDEPCGCCQDAARFIGSGEPHCPSCGHSVEDCASPTTGYTEDCCWNYTRFYCKGAGCACRCHCDDRPSDPRAVRVAAVRLTTAYLENPSVTLAGLKPHINALIEALDGASN